MSPITLCSTDKNSFLLSVPLHSLLSQPIQMNDVQEHLLKKGLIQGIPFSIYKRYNHYRN